MSDYSDGKDVLRRVPEPGRLYSSPKETIPENKTEVDANAIAEAVVKAIGNRIPVAIQGGQHGSGVDFSDGFDNSKTLERLADSMSVHGNGEESNFNGDIGKVEMTKKDKDDVQNTIDLLSDID